MQPGARTSSLKVGVLGPHPQAFTAQSAPTPTKIEAAMMTLGLTPPDASWYIDTGATSHMASSSSTLTSYSNLGPLHSILVGNGQSIPIAGTGNAC